MNIEEENEITAERKRSAIRDRARTFRELFGVWGAPTPHGKIVLDALTTKFGHVLPPNVLDSTGRTDEYQTWRRLGHFDVLEYIRTQLEWKESEHVNPSSSRP